MTFADAEVCTFFLKRKGENEKDGRIQAANVFDTLVTMPDDGNFQGRAKTASNRGIVLVV